VSYALKAVLNGRLDPDEGLVLLLRALSELP
jgi:hypothetical protein